MLKKILSISFFLCIFLGLWAEVIAHAQAATLQNTQITTSPSQVKQNSQEIVSIKNFQTGIFDNTTYSSKSGSGLNTLTFSLSLYQGTNIASAPLVQFFCYFPGYQQRVKNTKPLAVSNLPKDSTCGSSITSNSTVTIDASGTLTATFNATQTPGPYTIGLGYSTDTVGENGNIIIGSISSPITPINEIPKAPLVILAPNTPTPSPTPPPSGKSDLKVSGSATVDYGDTEAITVDDVPFTGTNQTLELEIQQRASSTQFAIGYNCLKIPTGTYNCTSEPFGGLPADPLSFSKTSSDRSKVTFEIDTKKLKLGNALGPNQPINYDVTAFFYGNGATNKATDYGTGSFQVTPALLISNITNVSNPSKTTFSPGDTISIQVMRHDTSVNNYEVGILDSGSPPQPISGDSQTIPCSPPLSLPTCALTTYILPNTFPPPVSYDIYVLHSIDSTHSLRADKVITGASPNITTQLRIYDPTSTTTRSLTDTSTFRCVVGSIDTSGCPTTLSTLYGTDIYHNNSDDDYRFGMIFTFDSNLGSPTPYSLSITKPGGGAVSAETNGTYGPQTFGSSGKTNRLAFFIKAFNSDNDPGIIGQFNYTLTYTPTAGKSYAIKQGTFQVKNPLLLGGGDSTHPASPFPNDGSAPFIPGTPQTITIKDASPNQHYALYLPTGSLSGYVLNTQNVHKSGDLPTSIDVGTLNPIFESKNTLCLTNNGFDTGALQKLKDAGKGVLNFVTFGVISSLVGELPFTPSDNPSMYCTWSVQITVESPPTPTPTPTPPLPPCLEYVSDINGTPMPLRSGIDKNGNFAIQTLPDPDLNGSPYPYRCAEVNTIFGAFSTDASGFISKVFAIILSISGGIVLISIIYAGYRILTSNGNPETLKAARERLTGAIIGLLFIIFSLVLLQFIGVNILGIPGFGN